jgi:hypothetical protein
VEYIFSSSNQTQPTCDFFRQLAAFLVREVKRLDPLPRYIRSIERTLVAKLIIQIDRQLRDESIK